MYCLAYVKHHIVIYFCADENGIISVRDLYISKRQLRRNKGINMLIFPRSGKKFFGRRMLLSEIGGGSLE